VSTLNRDELIRLFDEWLKEPSSCTPGHIPLAEYLSWYIKNQIHEEDFIGFVDFDLTQTLPIILDNAINLLADSGEETVSAYRTRIHREVPPWHGISSLTNMRYHLSRTATIELVVTLMEKVIDDSKKNALINEYFRSAENVILQAFYFMLMQVFTTGEIHSLTNENGMKIIVQRNIMQEKIEVRVIGNGLPYDYIDFIGFIYDKNNLSFRLKYFNGSLTDALNLLYTAKHVFKLQMIIESSLTN
jgi:hypothetical protein